MVEKYEAAADGKGYTFTLREGLLWHDGQPVTSETASPRSSAGQSRTRWSEMMTFVDSIDAVDAKTFTIKLKEPTGLVLLGLSKPSSNVPFMAQTRRRDGSQQADRGFYRSGPFVFVKDEWKPGDKTSTSVRTSTSHAPSRLGLPAARSSGGPREWRAISDAQQAVNSACKRRDRLHRAAEPRLLGTLKKDTNIAIARCHKSRRSTSPPEPPAQPFDNRSPPGVWTPQSGRLPDGDHR